MVMKITWDAHTCKHSAKCVENLPAVFKVENGEFVIVQDGAPEDDIRRVVSMCPTGALRAE